ncbi:1-acyl-sn-glycerol-3-phosphate acyltransferase [Spirulina subsalsa]|uniref:1-acyl-sn-glycerol-3-phosphate acyltransferase n=1 Tax=Spirulina subsalsa TaxID=54311 RepID=UPI0002F39634|nr:1-acyl-sn-glycerol-3-phosphate acyltransferase [Spirulina subsalsa]
MFQRHFAHPKLPFIPPRYNPLVLRLAHLLLPLFLRFRLRRWLIGGISRLETSPLDTLLHLYQQFQQGKIRLILAFRHSEVEDPLILIYLFSRAIPRAAQRQNISLTSPIHTHFLYDRGMTIWGGDWLGWVLSRGGGVPIHRGKPLDRTALKTARDLLINGQFPMTIAPEGATNGHSEKISPLEPGTAQLAFWAVEDLAKHQRKETVLLLPIGIQYYFIRPPWSKIGKLIQHLEKNLGLPPLPIVAEPDVLYQRLFKVAETLLLQMEDFYHRFHHCPISPVAVDSNSPPTQPLEQRLNHLLDVALTVAEDYFKIEPQGNFIDRCRRLEEVSWNVIYREDIPNWRGISAFQQGLADWVAQEAILQEKHMRLVESFVAVTSDYITAENITAERMAEVALILFDCVERIRGVKIPKRPRLGQRWVKITLGEPISASDRYGAYKAGRHQAKQAVKDLTAEIQAQLEGLIEASSGGLG